MRKHVPELPDFGTGITIRHLVHHTSGLRDQWSLLGLAGWRYSLDLITDDDVLELISRQRDLNFRPGEQHLYSNTGYTLMAQIVKRVSGVSFRDFTRTRLFEPLGMKNTRFRDDHAEIIKQQALGYVPARDTFRLSVTNFDTVGATSLLTTVEDLAVWDRNFEEPRVGGAAFIEQMHARGRLNDGTPLDYAFGLTHAAYKGLKIVEHSGGDAGYRAHLMRFPDQRFSVACLCNAGNANPGRLARSVAELYLAADMKEPPSVVETIVTLPAAELERHAGLYWSRDGDQIRKFVFTDGKLRLDLGGDRYELEPLGGDRFRAAGVPFRFVFGAEGRVSETIGENPRTTTYQPVDEFKPGPEELARYAGIYRSDEVETVFRVVLEKDGLVLKRLKSQPARLEPAVQDVFQGPPGSLRFTRDGTGRVTGAVLNSGRIRSFKLRREP